MNLDEFVVKAISVDAIVFCGAKPKRAYICFSSMNPGKYERWSWFYEMHSSGCEDLFIVLKDDNQHYYLGDENSATLLKHHSFLQSELEKRSISPQNTITVGSSMGGYAALYYGFWLGVRGVISVNPQIDYHSARKHNLPLWERKIREMGSRWIDLDQFICRFDNAPHIFIEHGNYPADVSAADKLVMALSERRITHHRSYTNDTHTGATLTKEKFWSIVTMLFDYPEPAKS
jgi:hypothetical protein